jgi:hypothetical protein
MANMDCKLFRNDPGNPQRTKSEIAGVAKATISECNHFFRAISAIIKMMPQNFSRDMMRSKMIARFQRSSSMAKTKK